MLMRGDESKNEVRSLPARTFARARQPLSPSAWAVAVTLAILLGYAAVFWIAGRNIADAFQASARNLISLAIVAVPFVWLIAVYVRKIGGVAEFAVHLVLAILFAYFWFFTLMIAIGFSQARSWADFDVRPVFPSPASIWQMAQGLSVYAALALALGWKSHTQAINIVPLPQPSPTSAQRYFVRKDGDALPIDLDRVVFVRGADDYSEVVTTAGTHLVRLPLSRFERETDPTRFCRIHRSVIVNITRVNRFEPDGSGRMLVWMDNGEQLRSSRHGAANLRARLI